MRQPEIVARVHTKEVHARIGQKVSAWLKGDSEGARKQMERIRNLCPTSNPEVRKKISKRLKEIGHKPHIQGGNGRPMPIPQKNLLDALGKGWIGEFVVLPRTREPGYPTHYKIDIANPQKMIAVEVDGYSHVAEVRKAQDAKKDALLRHLGWTVLRFTNSQVLSSIDTVMNQVALHSTT
jgi:hypothetical protein